MNVVIRPNKNEKTLMFIIAQNIYTLYKIEPSGGLCHIVTDDDNIRDDDLKWTIQHCNKPEYINNPCRLLCKTICEQLLLISFELRCVLFDMINSGYDIDIDTIDVYYDTHDISSSIKDWEDLLIW